MPQVSSPAPVHHSAPSGPSLRASSYDRVASLLVALLIIVGFSVSVLLLLWLARAALAVNRPLPVVLLDGEEGGREDPTRGMARELEEPGVEELAEVERPQLADTLAAVTTAVTSQQAGLDEDFGNSAVMGRGRGRGDARGLGDGGNGSRDVIPRWERLKVTFSPTQMEYARQLDFFNIELGALTTLADGSVQVDYVSQLAAASPTKRRGAAVDEQRLFFTEQTKELREFHRALLGKAGIDDTGRIVAQFYPPATEQKLALLERDHSAGRPIDEIRRTLFGIKAVGERFEFFVISQEYRQRP